MDMQVLVLLLLLCAGALGQDRVWTSMIGSSSTDEGKAVAIDPTTGSVYVAGYAQAALSGVLPWTTGNTLVVVKYARNGTQLYARQLQAVDYGSLSYVNGIAVSPNGQDVYVTGGTSDGSTLYVFVSQIRSDDGGASMARVFGPAGQNAGNSVAIDSNGYVYIVGQVCGSTQGASYIGGDSDILLIKYNSDGDVLWTRLLGTTGADEGYGVAIDTSDNIYISGAVSGGLDGEAYEGGARDMVLFKYTPEGARDWTRIAGTSGLDIGYAVVVDSAREAVYMTGTCEGPMHGQAYGGSTDICLLKYALDGTKIWTMQTGTSSGNNGYGIGLDASSGAVFVTGSAQGSLLDQGYVGDMDVFLMKVHANGTALWARMEGTMGADAGNAVAVDSSRGTVYVAGFASGSLHAEVYEGGYDIFLTSYLTDPAVPLPSSQPSSLPTSQPSAQYTNVCQSRTFRDIATQTNFTRHRCFTVPSIAPLPARSDFLCNPFSVSDTLYASSLSGADFSCQFTACPGDRVRMSMLPSDGGYCGGDPILRLIQGGGYPQSGVLVTIAGNDDFQGVCSMLEYDFSGTTECATYTAVQGCYEDSVCSGQTAIKRMAPYTRCEPYTCDLDYYDIERCIIPDNGPGLMVISTCSAIGGSCSSDNDHSLILTLQLIDSSYSSNYLESHFESLGNLSPSPCAGCSYITYTPSSSLDAADRYVVRAEYEGTFPSGVGQLVTRVQVTYPECT